MHTYGELVWKSLEFVTTHQFVLFTEKFFEKTGGFLRTPLELDGPQLPLPLMNLVRTLPDS
jgi:hypothetical protein